MVVLTGRRKVERSGDGGWWTEEDHWHFREGTHDRLYECLGAHPIRGRGGPATRFAVWAPNASSVSVAGDFNGWSHGASPLEPVGAGVWAAVVDGAREGHAYKLHVVPSGGGIGFWKADPFAFACEGPPGNASRIARLDHAWGDRAWLARRAAAQAPGAPLSIYEMHVASWRHPRCEGGPPFCAIAQALVDYLTEHAFTHVELLPVMEHPFGGSWGYQVTGYFAPCARYGSPRDLQALIDRLHQAGIGVILDWVPAHFPKDGHGLWRFDGTALYEHADPRRGEHPDWATAIFDYGRGEVQSFLRSNARFWIQRYHADGLRVDAVASMLYLDYSRGPGQWLPNVRGGRENLDAVSFLQGLNDGLHRDAPSVLTIAEESTAWEGVTRPTAEGGLGFDLKWDMGWMHDTLRYLKRDPVHRRYHHDELTFRRLYAYSERFLLPLSHDEVVHLKGSLLQKMAGDDWQRRANLRLLYLYQATTPGKTLLFMGQELGVPGEWNHDAAIDWGLLQNPAHAGIQRLTGDLNRLVRREPALHALDHAGAGFRWIDADDGDQSVLSYLRLGPAGAAPLAVALNFTPLPRRDLVLGVPWAGAWGEVLNTDAEVYGGSGVGNLGRVEARPSSHGGFPAQLRLSLPPLGALVLRGPVGPIG